MSSKSNRYLYVGMDGYHFSKKIGVREVGIVRKCYLKETKERKAL